MNVFVLTTGRSGSTSFWQACKHIENYSTGHESRAKLIGYERFNYPDNHIEIDNRLSWFLGNLELKYGDNAFYVHLLRDENKVAKSHIKRIRASTSITAAFSSGILKKPYYHLTRSELDEVSLFLIKTVNNNIESFLTNKTNKMTIRLENIEEEFESFFTRIKGQGKIEAAINSFSNKANTSANYNEPILYKLKNFFTRQLFLFRRL